MKQRRLHLFVLAAALFLSSIASAVTVKWNGLMYNCYINENGKAVAQVLRSGGVTGDVTIAEKISYNNTDYTVTSIQEQAFYYNSDITSVVIPNTIKEIPDQAFYYCKNLKSIAWPAQLASIGKQAFYYTAIDSLFLPDRVETLSQEAFSTCINLKYVELPKSLKAIGEKAFYNDGNIRKVMSYIEEPFAIPENVFFVNTSEGEMFGWGDLYVPAGTKDKYLATTGWNGFSTIEEMEPENPEPENPAYKDGELFTAKTPEGVTMTFMVISAADKTCKTYSRRGVTGTCIDESTTGTVTVPAEVNGFKVVEIGEYTLRMLNGLTAINISDGIATISRQAIALCHNITSITIPASVTSIGGGNFCSCHSLTSLVVDSNNPVYDSRNNCNAVVETATNKIVAGCNTTYIFDGVTAIGESAFLYVLALTKLHLPSTVTSIERYAFYGCYNLESVVVPKAVTSMEEAPFSCCNSLTSLSVEDGNPKYDSRNNCNAIIETSTDKIISACNVSFIPEGIKTIGSQAFQSLSSIEEITIPKSVESIEDAAFYKCTNLKVVNFAPEGIKTIGRDAFTWCSSIEEITIPKSVVSIEHGAFNSCSNLKVVKSFIEEPFVPGSYCFYAISDDATLYVPVGTKAKYEATDGWKYFKKILEMSPYNVLDNNTVAANFLQPDAEGKVVIPATVEIDGKTYSVTEIAARAFKNNKALTEVTIPATVTKIGDEAFAGCENLRAIYVLAPEPIILAVSETRAITTRAVESDVPSQLEGIDFDACMLYVLEGSEQKYRESEGWKLFTHIVGIPDPSGISAVSVKLDGTPYVYNLSGQRVATSKKGIYIRNGRKIVIN